VASEILLETKFVTLMRDLQYVVTILQ